MGEPLDRDTLFKKLRSKPENKVCLGGCCGPSRPAERLTATLRCPGLL
jgi:hypothetical protein